MKCRTLFHIKQLDRSMKALFGPVVFYSIYEVNKEYRKMSWEGYEVTVCENAHIVTLDPHADTGNKCPTCGGKVVQYFRFDNTNGDEAESRHNKRKWKTVNRVAAKILRSNPEEIERRIKDVQKRKDKFLKGIQNTLNNYDKEIESLRAMLEGKK